jgi:glycosyltransferase involved in cell wall biosynthesis
MSSTEVKSSTTKKPLRVLMVTGVYPTEQNPHSGTFIKSQTDSLIATGLDVELLHPRPGPSPLRYTLAALQVFLKTLTGHFDVVHAHYGLWCLAARMQWTTPVVGSFLGDDLLGTVTADGSYSKKGALVVKVSQWLCRHLDAAIVKSNPMKAALGQQDKVYVIPNGVDFNLFRPLPRAEVRAALGWHPNRYYVLFGNDPAIPVKNFPLAQAAIERLQARKIDVELVVAKGLPQTTVVQYINACNALILPSIAEGSPNIVKETMACSVPVVATNVGDVAQMISRTEGCSVCDSNPEALAAGLEQALLREEPTTGRRDIEHLNSAIVAQQVIKVYERVTQKKIPGHSKDPSLTLKQESAYAKDP